MDALSFYKCLADATRLRLLLLLTRESELCVCELTESLGDSQPKISRHLAQLRACKLIQDRRQGQWVFYRLDDKLPRWCREVLEQTLRAEQDLITQACLDLDNMSRRALRCAP
ncbi:MAG: metalloregulator ArsR/SmtB family transcription factor [Pseudomonadales bacterium]|nr:metalloregulator ArsR/SmtB family transcription factor [Pseudomonadales bacterium]